MTSPSNSTSRPLRCGIVGAGRIAWAYDGGSPDPDKSLTHASCFARDPRTKLVAMLDTDRDALDAFTRRNPGLSTGTALTTEPDQFFSQDLDLISICAPADQRSEHISRSFAQSPRYLWIEKPVAPDLATYERLLEAYQSLSNKPRISVNYCRRNMPQYRRLIEDVVENLETLVCVEVTYSRSLAINGVHMLDLVGAMFGDQCPSKLDWVQHASGPNPSFGFSIEGCPIFVHGLDTPYHCIEIRATFQDKRVAITRSGYEVIEEHRIPNPDYPETSLLSSATRSNRSVEATDIMRDPLYPNLCNLLSDDSPILSSIETAGFVQKILHLVQD
ncbi:MAG: Gfo/Idh/MocA family oxidoreductase [Pseudomonadota bacterium]